MNKDKKNGHKSVERAKKFVGSREVARCLETLKPGYGYMEVALGTGEIKKVEHRQ